MTAATERFGAARALPAGKRRTVIGAFAPIVFAKPLVNHYVLSVMTDSLAATFGTTGLAALIRLSALGDTRRRTVLTGGFAIAAAGFMRAEKVLLLGLTVAVAIVAAWWLTRSTGSLHRRRILGCLAGLLLVPGLAVTAVNRATQTPGLHGWPPDTAELRLFIWTVWPRLTELRPVLSPEFQSVVSVRDAEAFDADYNQLLHLAPRLQQRAGGTIRLLNEASRAAIRHHGGAILWTATQDALRYAVPLLA